MKLVFIYLVSWLSGMIVSVAVTHFYFREPFSTADLLGFATLSFVPSVFVCGLLYTPGFLWLKRRRGKCEPGFLFPLAALVLNAPVILVLVLLSGRAMGSSEAVSFLVIFSVMGLMSGAGFVWWCNNRSSAKSSLQS